MWNGPIWLTVFRDLVLLAGGLSGIIHEEFTGTANIPLLCIYTAMMGIPGAAATLWLGQRDTASRLPPSPPDAS